MEAQSRWASCTTLFIVQNGKDSTSFRNDKHANISTQKLLSIEIILCHNLLNFIHDTKKANINTAVTSTWMLSCEMNLKQTLLDPVVQSKHRATYMV